MRFPRCLHQLCLPRQVMTLSAPFWLFALVWAVVSLWCFAGGMRDAWRQVAEVWARAMGIMAERSPWCRPNRLASFAPPAAGNTCRWLVDGVDTFAAVAAAIDAATAGAASSGAGRARCRVTLR